MDNIDYLLQSLNTETFEQSIVEGNVNDVSFAETNVNGNGIKPKSSESKENDAQIFQPIDSHSSQGSKFVGDNIENREYMKSLESEFNLESIKKQTSSKYGQYGDEINKRLKEIKLQRYEIKETQSSWNTKVDREKSTLAPPSVSRTVENNVYVEPIFGLRIINPLLSSSFIQAKMNGRHPVGISEISYHLTCGDKNTDWVFAGAIVLKSGLKTSQKGSQYCQWKISNLKNDLKQVTLYLFGKACTDLWKVPLGTVAAVLNAVPFHKDEKSSNEVTLIVRTADQVLILGTARDYGICKAKKKNGENCTAFINKSLCEYCVYHIRSEYNKFAASRFNVQSPVSGLNALRNKVLGKNEVFYAGKSYTAVNVAKKSKKLEERNNFLLNQLSGDRKKYLETCEVDKKTKELIQPSSSTATLPSIKENHIDLTPEIVVRSIKEKVCQKKVSGLANIKIDLKSTKPIVSRSHLLEEATERVIQTGEVTRVTTDNIKNSKVYCFADVFKDKMKGEVSLRQTKAVGKFTLSKENDVIRLSDGTSSSQPLRSFKGLMTNASLPMTIQFPSKASQPQRIRSLSDRRFRTKSTLHSGHLVSNAIQEAKKARVKIEAIKAIKKVGGLTKTNPNRVRPDPEKRKSLKRPADTSDTEDAGKTLEKSILSPRFLELMNTTSKHEHLVHLAEIIERQNYFNKMEKKEQLEEKMLTLYKLPCKAVVCLKCKYKWFSASDLCKAENHPIKVVDAIKRFFKCDNCTNRTVCLEMIPVMNCKQCGSSKWSRTGMIRDTLIKNDNDLSIRGDEVKHFDSLSHQININLLVPDE